MDDTKETEEMSGWWLPNGSRELTKNELAENRRRNRIKHSVRRLQLQEKSFCWLQRRLGLDANFGLAEMLSLMDAEGSAMFYYPPRVIPKPEGGSRIIITPQPELMLVQKRIHRLLRQTFSRPAHAFGYRGGSCLELVKRHQEWKSTIKFDVKNAFFRVGYARLRSALRGHRRYKLTPRFEWLKSFSPGFSGSVAHWIAKLCTYSPVPDIVPRRRGFLPINARSFLPQGAPTSPICFDLACALLDKKLAKIAAKVGGIVSRYADNYYFSVQEPKISKKLEAMIVCSTQKRYGFPIHKLRVVNQGQLCRMLGYNLENGNIRNTRGFLRKLRGALHVLRTKIERNLDWENDYRRVRGLMGWAVNLPGKLQWAYEDCVAKIAGL